MRRAGSWPQAGTAEGDGPVALLGRDQEVVAASAAMLAGRSVLIVGEAGIGKTTLLEAAMKAAGVETPIVRATQPARHLPLLPLRSAFQPGLLTGTTERIGARLAGYLGGQTLVVDDLHWCDDDTLEVLATALLEVKVVATVWPAAGPAASLVRDLSRSATIVHLEGLDDEAASKLVQARRPGAFEAEVSEWVARGDGNPLLLECLVEAGSLGDPRAPPIDRVRAYVACLGAGAINALARVSVFGRPVNSATVGDHVEPLLELGVVEITDGSLEVRHPAFGAAALALVGEDSAAALHRWAADMTEDPAERAYHLAAACDPGARAAALDAAGRTSSLLERARLLQIAAQLTPPGSDDELVANAADALVDAGRYEPAQAALQGMEPSDRSIATRRAVALARAAWARNDLETARRHVEAGLELLEGAPTASHVDLLSIRTRLSARVDWDASAALDSARAALSLAETIGERLSAAHGAMGTAWLRNGDPRFADHLRSAIDLAGDDVVSGAIAADTLFMGQLLLGDPAACRPIAENMAARIRGISGLWEQQLRKNALLAALHVDCDYDAVLTEAPRLLRAPATPRIREHLESTLVLAHADVGDDEAALRVASTMSGLEGQDTTARAMAKWAIAEAHWLAGRSDLGWEAAREAARLPVAGFPAHVLASVVGAWCSHATGLPMDAWIVDSPFVNLQPAREEVEGLRLLPTNPAKSRDAFLKAARTWAPLSRRYAIRARWAAAESALAAGDEALARELLLAAEDECVGLSSVAMLRRIRHSLRGLGVRRRDSVPSDAVLTPTQQLVLGLVGRGLTSGDIANQLAVSTTTVDTHVRTAMRELGARTRLAAAIRAESHGSAADDSPRFTVTRDPDDHEAARREAAAKGNEIVELAYAGRAEPPLGRRVVAEGSVSTLEDASAALAASYRGYALVLRLDARLGESVRVLLIDSLRRLGLLEIHKAGGSPTPTLSPLQERLLDGLAAGTTIAELAIENAVSRRTVERRLAAARRALEAQNNAEAVTRWRRTAA